MILKTNDKCLKIPTPIEFSFDECLVFLNRSSQENLHRIKDECITKLINLEEEMILISITHLQQHLHIEFLNGTSSVEGQRAAGKS